MQPAGWFLIAVAAVLIIGVVASKSASKKDDSENK
mgnify:CR=1 FL=1